MSKDEIILSIVLAIIGSSTFTTFVQFILDRVVSKNPWKQGTKFNLLLNLQNEARRIISNEEVSRLEYNQFTEMYDVYKKMKGDGYADTLKAQVDLIANNSIMKKGEK